MLEIDNLSCQRGERRVFSRVSLTVEAGKLVAVSGANGSGKSSLLRMLCGLLPPEQGQILWKGQDIAELKEHYMGQVLYIGHLNGLKDELTAVENLHMAAQLSGEPASVVAAREALSAIGLTDRIHDLPARVLSQGQKRRAALARLWLSARPLWILDEPFASLDESSMCLLTGRLQSQIDGGGIVIMATHDDVAIAPDSVQSMRLDG